MSQAPLRYTGFEKGITDYFVDPPAGYARVLDNLLLTPQGKPYQRPGSVVWGNTLVLTNAERIAKLATYWATSAVAPYLLMYAQNTLYDSLVDSTGAASGFTYECQGIDGTKGFKWGTLYARFNSWLAGTETLVGWEHDVSAANYGDATRTPMVVYPLDFSGGTAAFALRTAGLPEASRFGMTITPHGGAGANTYIYYLVNEYTWTDASGTSFLRLSSPTTGKATDARVAVGAATGFTLASIPAVPLSFTKSAVVIPFHYATATLKIRVYRTLANGTTPFLVGKIAYNAGSYLDEMNDATAAVAEPLYTVDGTQPYGMPPLCRYALYLNGFGYYGGLSNTWAGGGNFPCRLFQSTPGIFDAVPPTFFVDFEQPITGLSYYDIYPLVFLRSMLYRVEGNLDSLGNGSLDKHLVSASVGTLSNSGVVVVGRQVFFPGNDGFYVTNGYTATKISPHLNLSYAAWTQTFLQQQKITGEFNPGDNRIYWSVVSSSGSTDNDLLVVLDLNLPIEGGGAFSTWSGGVQTGSFYPTCVYPVAGGQLLRGDRRGYVFVHNSVLLDDPVVDVSKSATLWARAGVYYDLQTPVTSMGSEKATKWVSKIYPTLDFLANGQTTTQQLLLSVERENSNSWKDLSKIRTTGLSVSIGKMLSYKRYLPVSTHRSKLWSFRMRKPWANVFKSDDYATATVTGTNTAALAAGNWPAGIEAVAVISFATDGYVAEYPVLTRAGGTITMSGAPANGAGLKWVIRNYPPDETFQFNSLEIPFVAFGGLSNVLGQTSAEDNKNA